MSLEELKKASAGQSQMSNRKLRPAGSHPEAPGKKSGKAEGGDCEEHGMPVDGDEDVGRAAQIPVPEEVVALVEAFPPWWKAAMKAEREATSPCKKK